MEFVAIAQLLWSRRILVAIGVVAAVAAGMLAGRSTGSAASVGSSLGSVQIVLDTTDSQLVEAAPVGADMLPTRATLLADTLSTDTGRAIIARAAGVPLEKLAVLGPSATMVPVVDSPLTIQVAAGVAGGGAPYVVEASADEMTPMITIQTQAPDAARARSLAVATEAGLRALLAREDTTRSRGFVFNTATPLRVKQVPAASHRSLMMLGAALMTFALWCGCIVLIAGASRRMRLARAGSAERSPAPDALFEREAHRNVRWL